MRIIPVLDVLNGRVVRGVAGQRDSYQPIQSLLTPSSDAREICRAFEREFGLNEYYVADLDGIERGIPNTRVLQDILDVGISIWLDAGFSSVSRLHALQQHIELEKLARIIVGLECCAELADLRSLLEVIGTNRFVFSLDLKNEMPLLADNACSQWAQAMPLEIVQQVVELGVQSMIVLDLAAVGMGAGTPTLDLCRQLKQEYPWLEIITGGGVNCVDDLMELEGHCDGVLIASALHDGRILPADLTRFR